MRLGITKGNWGGLGLMLGALTVGFQWVGCDDYSSKSRATLASWHARKSPEWRWALYWGRRFSRPAIQWNYGIRTAHLAWFTFCYQPRLR